ncbi:hypothetical protein [uncultured Chryseobacterium sp.]|jgi:hypothetical protein|uniref:hypothetical protein n=1 Tax=uncultured Chryseobacterium sp. TaxID=259322 RepID=UPI00260929D3|nr:hypothetical protein [uncultured Chryseobacterium sp.]
MKKLLSIFILTSLLTVSCKPDEDLYFEGESLLHFDLPVQTASEGDAAVTYGVTKPVDGDHSVTLVFDQSKSSAVLGTDFTIVESTDVLKAGSSRGDFKINVTKAAAIAKKNAVFTMTNNSLKRASFNQEVLVNFACESMLAGTYEYSTVNYFTPDLGTIGTTPRTGTVTFTATSITGEYTITDASFGAYGGWYGGVAANVRLRDQCNTLSFAGTNQYGDQHSISNVVVAGNKLTFKWTTTYGEYGTTTLTKANGNWPALN